MSAMAGVQFVYTMKGLGKVYGPKRKVLEDIWLSFYPGAKIGVLGLNGSGKSTLLRIMAGEDTEYLGEAGPAQGVTVGYLPQEPRLDPGHTVSQAVEEGVAETARAADGVRVGQREVRRADGRRRDGEAPRRAGAAAGRDRRVGRVGARPASSTSRWTPCASPRATCRWRRCRAAKSAASRFAGSCSASPTCCSSTSRPTTSTPSRSPGWSAISPSIPAPWWRSPTTGISSTTSPGGSSSSTAGAGIPWEGNYSSWLEQKKTRLEMEEKQATTRRKTLERELEWIRMAPARAPREGEGAPERVREAARRRTRSTGSRRGPSPFRRGRAWATWSSRRKGCPSRTASGCSSRT